MHAKAYIEVRNAFDAKGHDSLAADLMRHLHTRQYLGKTVVICDQPNAMLSTTRKQWLKLSRTLQRQRASTLNADKILKFTHGIAHMQHLRFGTKDPLEHPSTDIFFLQPDNTSILPAQCFSVYLATPFDPSVLSAIIEQLPSEALIIDYAVHADWSELGVEPKKELEKQVTRQWRQVKRFLQAYNIDVANITRNELHDVEAMDDALDTLLSMSHKFLHIASEFQHTLELARPLRIQKATREQYDSLILLAHRVQALTPGTFTQQFLQVYNEDDTFFLHDIVREHLEQVGETFQEGFLRHIKAGRKHLARALHYAYMGRSLKPTR